MLYSFHGAFVFCTRKLNLAAALLPTLASNWRDVINNYKLEWLLGSRTLILLAFCFGEKKKFMITIHDIFVMFIPFF